MSLRSLGGMPPRVLTEGCYEGCYDGHRHKPLLKTTDQSERDNDDDHAPPVECFRAESHHIHGNVHGEQQPCKPDVLTCRTTKHGRVAVFS